MAGRRPFWKTGVNTDPNSGVHFTEEQVRRQAQDRKNRILPPSDDLAITRLMKVFDSATDQDIAEGMEWYQTANQVCVELAQSRPTVVRSVVHAAGIVAALSPRLQWKDNIRRAKQLVETGDTHGIRDRVQKAKTIMQGDDPYGVIFAPRTSNWKVRSFFMNIAFPDWPHHDSTEELPEHISSEPAFVTVDRHCWSLLYDDRSIGHVLLRPSPQQYDWARDIFTITAKELEGVLPQQLQAITWVAWRHRRTLRSEDETPRLFEID